MSEKLCIYSCCFPVKGYSRGILYDVDRMDYSFIPNRLVELIKNSISNNINYTVIELDKNDEYTTFLIENDYAFMSSEPYNFNQINLEWDDYSVITNSVIEITDSNINGIKLIIDAINKLQCKSLEIVFSNRLNLSQIHSVRS